LKQAETYGSPASPIVARASWGRRRKTTKGDAEFRLREESTDEAIREAAKVAIDEGDLDRARALLDLLDVGPRPAPVVNLAAGRPVDLSATKRR
jgi:hypothetical protein